MRESLRFVLSQWKQRNKQSSDSFLQKEDENMISGAIMVPHPPIALKEVGHGEEKKIQKTLDAYEKAAEFVAQLKPDVLVITSPHTNGYADYFNISKGSRAAGSMAQFNAPQVRFEVDYDTDFVYALEQEAKEAGFPAGSQYDRPTQLDHGVMVPLYFIQKYVPNIPIVRIALSGLPMEKNYELGELIAKASDRTNKNVVIVASGDLSHCQLETGPYGYKPAGPEYDRRIMADMAAGAFEALFDYDPAFLQEAAECGHGSFAIMAGAFDGHDVKIRELSHEATFGVGYGVILFKNEGIDDKRHFLENRLDKEKAKIDEKIAGSDAYAKLARASVKAAVLEAPLELPDDLPEEMLKNMAGAFVSIHEFDELRGCIGTIAATQDSVAEEIIKNAWSASQNDPRFAPIKAEELPYLDISVDILSDAEPIHDKSELDVKKYGVIVTKGGRRGLLLPNLDGVDTIDQQIEIACRKAGIDPKEPGIQMERFEVVRHV